MWWLILPAILALLLLIPIGIIVRYCDRQLQCWLRIGVLKIPVQRKNSAKKRSGSKSKKGESFEETRADKKFSGNIKEYFSLLSTVLDFLDTFRRKLKINQLTFEMTLGGDDPYDLSINYGRAWGVLGTVQPILERYFIIKKKDIDLFCDYTSSKTTVYAFVDMTLTVGNVLSIAGFHGIRFLRKFLKITNKSKGGAMI